MHIELNAYTIAKIDAYVKAACRRFRIVDPNAIADVRGDAMLQACQSFRDFDPRLDRNDRGRMHFVRVRASYAAKLSARRNAEQRDKFRTNMETE